MISNTKVSIQAIDFKQMKPEDVFKWLELFSFKRYGEKYYIDPKKRVDPRYPVEIDESPPDWYTHLAVPSHYFNRNCIIIDEEQYNRIKENFIHLNGGQKDEASS